MRTRRKWYVGHVANGLEAFHSDCTPTESSHGNQYRAVIGPFRTKRGAKWTERYGYMNPHFVTVDDAERLATIV